MKNIFKLSFCLGLLFILTSCNNYTLKKEYSATEILKIYGTDSYEVSYFDYSNEEYLTYDEYIVVKDENDLEAFFYFFENENLAYDYAKENDWSILLWFYSAIQGNPIWPTYEQHGKMVVSYVDAKILNPILNYESTTN